MQSTGPVGADVGEEVLSTVPSAGADVGAGVWTTGLGPQREDGLGTHPSGVVHMATTDVLAARCLSGLQLRDTSVQGN